MRKKQDKNLVCHCHCFRIYLTPPDKQLPSHTARMPRKTLRATYRADNNASPTLSMANDSLAKVLKVVKPPQNPVTSSNFISGTSTPLFTHPTKKPISSEPTMLTTKVPNGKDSTFHPDSR